MSNTPFIHLVKLSLLLILSIGALVAKAHQQEEEVVNIDILSRYVNHDDTLNTDTLKTYGKLRGQESPVTDDTHTDHFVAKSFKNTRTEKDQKIETLESLSIDNTPNKVQPKSDYSVDTLQRLHKWFGRLIVILSSILVILGGVYIFSFKNKTATKQIGETAPSRKDYTVDETKGAIKKPQASAYDRFVEKLRKDFAEGDTDKVIRQLLILTKGTNTHEIVTMLAGQWEELQKELVAGGLMHDVYLADLEIIRKTVLEVIDGLEA